MSDFFGLFEAYGIELEYMIVDRETLEIRPIADQLLKIAAGGEQVSDFADGDITWSNELVLHVIELKTTAPARTLLNLENSFQRSVSKANSLLAPLGAMLMPTAMHPFMHPSQMKLWPHDNSEIYDTYNRIFDCRGHGWSNLQSMHINLPFRTDDEFFRLHTAIRFLLPLLPSLAASSPIVEGKATDARDNRLLFYQQNQRRVPSIAGQIVPEPVRSIEDYRSSILSRMYSDISPHDPDEILCDDWLNSRGAIARFERQSIEIRVLDIQESPAADLALADLICALLKRLAKGEILSTEAQLALGTEELKKVFDAAAVGAETAEVPARYLEAWGHRAPATFAQLLRHVVAKLPSDSISEPHRRSIETLLTKGSLASRILRSLGNTISSATIRETYSALSATLAQGRAFDG